MISVHISQLNAHPFSGQDIRSLFDHRARTRPDHPFLIWSPLSGREAVWSYTSFRNRLATFGAGLYKRGVRANDRVLIHLDNCPESLIAWLGCAWIGAIGVTTNTRSSADELAYFASHSRSVAAITQPKYADLVKLTCANLRWIAVTATDCGEQPLKSARSDWAVEFDGVEADPDIVPKRPHDPVAPFAIQYTSGTTSRPKAVLWTHANALWGARVNAAHEDLRPDDVHWTAMPLFHTNAQAYSVLASAWAGCSCVLQSRFSASQFWPVSLKYGCTWASMIPFFERALREQPVPPDHRYRLWGGAVCAPPTDAYFGIKTIGWWGMTETITHGIVGSAHLANTPMTIGRVAPEYRLKILTDDGRPALSGETGELRIYGIRGLSLFSEYVENPRATEDAFDEDGYLITGDRVQIQDDGALVFADRSKDMLKVGGENVAASEIERVIMEVSGITEVAVVARKHPMLDEVPVAFVLATTPVRPNLCDEVISACQQKLADFKVPRDVRLVDSLPRSTLEKIAKAQLRALLDAEIGTSDS